MTHTSWTEYINVIQVLFSGWPLRATYFIATLLDQPTPSAPFL